MSVREELPTQRALSLELDKLSVDEVAFLVFVVDALRKGELVTVVGGKDEFTLERLAMKLKAHRTATTEPPKEGI